MALAALASCYCGALILKPVPAHIRADLVSLTWAGLSILLAAFEPAMSYLFLIPTTFAVLCRFLPQSLHQTLMVCVSGVILLPTLHLLPPALGAPGAAIICPIFAVFSTVLWPVLVPAPIDQNGGPALARPG